MAKIAIKVVLVQLENMQEVLWLLVSSLHLAGYPLECPDLSQMQQQRFRLHGIAKWTPCRSTEMLESILCLLMPLQMGRTSPAAANAAAPFANPLTPPAPLATAAPLEARAKAPTSTALRFEAAQAATLLPTMLETFSRIAPEYCAGAAISRARLRAHISRPVRAVE